MSESRKSKAFEWPLLIGLALLPVLPICQGLTFGAGAPSDKVLDARFYLRPEQILLVVLTVLALFRSPSGGRDRLASLWMKLMLACVVWILLANTVLRDPSIAALREVKNQAIPALLSFFVFRSFASDTRALRRALTSLSIGIAAAVLIVLMRVNPSGDEIVRRVQIQRLQYTWLALVSGIGFCASLALFPRMGIRGRVLLVVTALMALVGAYVAGNRAVLYTLLLSPVILWGIKVLPARATLAIGVGILTVSILTSCWPGDVIEVMPDGLPDRAVGAERIVPDPSVLSGSVRGRLYEWDAMIYDRSPWALLCGMDYGKAMSRTDVFRHPHSIFVWMLLEGGLVAVVLFASVLFLAWYRAAMAATRAASESDRLLARVILLGHLMLLGVLVSNSWAGGAAAMLVGFWSAASFSLPMVPACAGGCVTVRCMTASCATARSAPVLRCCRSAAVGQGT